MFIMQRVFIFTPFIIKRWIYISSVAPASTMHPARYRYSLTSLWKKPKVICLERPSCGIAPGKIQAAHLNSHTTNVVRYYTCRRVAYSFALTACAFLRIGSIFVAFITSPFTFSFPAMNNRWAFAFPLTNFPKSSSERARVTVRRRISHEARGKWRIVVGAVKQILHRLGLPRRKYNYL